MGNPTLPGSYSWPYILGPVSRHRAWLLLPALQQYRGISAAFCRHPAVSHKLCTFSILFPAGDIQNLAAESNSSHSANDTWQYHAYKKVWSQSSRLYQTVLSGCGFDRCQPSAVQKVQPLFMKRNLKEFLLHFICIAGRFIKSAIRPCAA